MDHRLLAVGILVHGLPRQSTSGSGLPFGIDIPLAIVLMVAQPVTEQSMTNVFRAVRTKYMDIRVWFVETEEAMLIPARLAKQELKTRSLKGWHVGVFRRGVSYEYVNIDDRFGW